MPQAGRKSGLNKGRQLLDEIINLWYTLILIRSQYFLLSKSGEIRRDEACFDYSGKDVILYPCHGAKGNQQWIYNHTIHQIKHGTSGKCLEISPNRDKLWMRICNPDNPNQMWKFENYDPSKLDH